MSKYGYNYAMLGFDIGNYFIANFSKYGKEAGKYLPCLKSNSIMAPFEFSKISETGGYYNNYLRHFKYDRDYKIENNVSVLK